MSGGLKEEKQQATRLSGKGNVQREEPGRRLVCPVIISRGWEETPH